MSDRLRRLVDRAFAPADRYITRQVNAALDDGPVEQCAAGCGRPVVLADTHYTVTRTTEREYEGVVTPVGGDALAHVHLDCWPARSATVVITAGLDSPDTARLTVDRGRS